MEEKNEKILTFVNTKSKERVLKLVQDLRECFKEKEKGWKSWLFG